MLFLELCFLGKISRSALRGRPQPLKKPSQSQKGKISKKMNVTDDTKTPKLANSAKKTGNIYEILWHLSRHGLKANLQMAQLAF